MTRWRPITLLVACAALAAAIVAGCGGDDDSGGDVDVGPAAAVPANTPIYIDLTVKPTGAAQADASAALGKILDTDDPGAKIIQLIDKEGASQPANEQFTYAADIEPWLGEQAAVFFTSLADDSEGAVVVETTNPEQALASARKSESGATQTSEQAGTTIYTNPTDHDSFAVIGDFMVFGDEAGVKAAIEANDGDSLGDSSDFTDTLAELPDDRLGTLYTVPKTLLDAIPDDQIDPGSQTFFENAAGENIDEPVGGALTASADTINLEFQSQGDSDVETPESSLLGAVPGDSWLALGIGNLGDNIKQTLEQLKESGDFPELANGISQAESATGASIDDLTGSLGDGVIYVKGATVPTLTGALVVQVNDTELVGRLIGQLQGLLSLSPTSGVKPLSIGGGTGFQINDPSNFPAPIEIVQSGDKLVIGYGAGSAQEALQPAQPLSGSPPFSTAESQVSSLGADLFLSFPAVFQLAESTGATKDPGYNQAKPYIDALDYLIEGSGTSDGNLEAKAVLGLK